jgi:two-component system, cell cycle sensor histidine kinase and response regulator CckA
MKPDTRTLFMSGYTADVIHKQGLLARNMLFILKPVSPRELLQKIRDVLAG